MAKGAATAAAKKAPAKKATTAKGRPRKKAGSAAAKSKATAPAVPAAAAAVSASSSTAVPDRGPLPTLILDSGGWTVKHGTVLPSSASAPASAATTAAAAAPRLSPNATAKPHHQLTILCADQISQIANQGQLIYSRPLERGYITDLTAQLRVWRRVCELEGVLVQPVALTAEDAAELSGVWAATTMAAGSKKRGAGSSRAATPANAELPVPTLPSTHCQVVLLTQPFTPKSISERVDEVWFRDLGFVRVGKILGQCAAAARYADPEERKELRLVHNDVPPDDDGTECCLVVDSGFSLTHVVPTYQCQAVSRAIRRLNIGGRTITNLLKEWVSYRQWNMMDETALVNEAKEVLCYVLPSSSKYDAEMAEARKTKVGYREYDREFVLPDFAETFAGSVRLASGLRKRLDQKERERERRERKELKKRQRQKEKEAKEKEEAERKGKEDGETSKGNENANKRGMKKKGGKRKLDSKNTNKEDSADDNDSNAEEVDDDDEVDSDEETDEQRLKRIQRMKEEERRRRELEEESRQALALSVERFAAPEILFRPDDVGLDQGGIAETIVQSVEACPDYLRAAMYQNVLITGGNARIPGFAQRLESELRSLAPSQYAVRVCVPQDPVTYAWKGAQKVSQQVSMSSASNGRNSSETGNIDAFRKCFVDRTQWEAGASGDNCTEDDMIVM